MSGLTVNPMVLTYAEQLLPLSREEMKTIRREQFLQGPACFKDLSTTYLQLLEALDDVTSRKPSAFAEVFIEVIFVRTLIDIFQISKTHERPFVPRVHGINRFLEFSTAALVDTASINPDPVQFICFSLPYCVQQLWKRFSFASSPFDDV